MTNEPINEAFTLDVDVTGAELDFPVFPPQIVPCRIKGFRRTESKNTGMPMIEVVLESIKELTTINGVTKSAGFPFIYRIMDGPSVKNPSWDWQKAKKDALGQLRFAALGERTGTFGATDQYVDKIVGVKLKVKDDRNEIDRLLPVDAQALA